MRTTIPTTSRLDLRASRRITVLIRRGGSPSLALHLHGGGLLCRDCIAADLPAIRRALHRSERGADAPFIPVLVTPDTAGGRTCARCKVTIPEHRPHTAAATL